MCYGSVLTQCPSTFHDFIAPEIKKEEQENSDLIGSGVEVEQENSDLIGSGVQVGTREQ